MIENQISNVENVMEIQNDVKLDKKMTESDPRAKCIDLVEDKKILYR